MHQASQLPVEQRALLVTLKAHWGASSPRCIAKQHAFAPSSLLNLAIMGARQPSLQPQEGTYLVFGLCYKLFKGYICFFNIAKFCKNSVGKNIRKYFKTILN